jgi:hypothetical protein
MTTIQQIEFFLKTLYPGLEFHLHPQWKNHSEMDLPHTWTYSVEALNVSPYLIYDPQTFNPVVKLTNGSIFDYVTVGEMLLSFAPTLFDKLDSIFYLRDTGEILDLYRKEYVKDNLHKSRLVNYA